MRALILRRVGLIETGTGGPVLIGAPASPDVLRLRSFLSRNGYPHQFFDPASDQDARAFIDRYVPSPDDLPLVVCPDGTVLRNPTESELAKCIGMLDSGATSEVSDVAIVGAGPAGLATAVYAASEGLSVIVIDARHYGGQAGASARIENLLGFPTGISGQALAGGYDTRSIQHVFFFLVADPNAYCLIYCDVAFYYKLFVKTCTVPELPLVTTVPVVFAVCDFRACS